MAANVFNNVFRRGRDVARVVLRRQARPTPPVNKTDNVRQPAIYTALVRCQTPVVPSRIGLFIRTNVSIYKALASQLRRRAAFEYGRLNGRTIPFLGFVGVALSTSNQDQDDSLSGKIRDVVQKRIKNIPITQQLRLDSLDLGNVIGQGCNSDWFDGQLQQLQRDITTLINASDFVENPRLPQIVPSKEEEREDKWYPPIKENSQREITDDLSNCKLSTTSSCEESFVAINEDRDVVQKIDNSPTIQQLHLEILDMDKCNQLDDSEREITSLENASDFVENPSLPHILPLIKEEEEKIVPLINEEEEKIVPLINEEEEKIVPLINEEESEDKWFPPAEENSQREISDGSISCGSSCKLSISSSCDDGFVVIDADRESSFCELEADENSVPKSFPLCSSDSDSMMSSDTDTSRECDSCPETSSKVEDDKWSVMDELDYPESMMSVDSDTDLKNDSSSVTSNEDDKWSVMDGLDYKGVAYI